MTWQTPDGDRWLEDSEASLVRDVLGVMVDRLTENLACDDEKFWNFGVFAFDELTSTQQLTVLGQVATHLLTETPEPLELSAVNESAVYSIFRVLASEIETEIESEIDIDHISGLDAQSKEWLTEWRKSALAAYHQTMGEPVIEEPLPADCMFGDMEDDEPPLTVDCSEFARWESVTEQLADQILWDRDFDMAGEFLDAQPAQAALLKQHMGIEPDYYTSVASDVLPEQIESQLTSIRKLTHRKPK